MFPALWAAAAEAGPIILLPVSITIGFIGYKIESYITRNKEDNQRASIISSLTASPNMWHITAAWRLAQRYAPIVMLPVSMVVGYIGYNLEKLRSDNGSASSSPSVIETRDERCADDLLKDPTNVPSLKSKVDMPKTSLLTNDPSRLHEKR
ncbi:hypothetical protein EB796_002836 [Bugula neritina]|uniref:Uncharacterized protein n=1 Tax=Bugula neritina TaxID=10212 RepID=A0A7J7KLM8_BUGNE|nr:hypothetical protein EB796_002836 [Bugula neritina]